MGYTRISGSRLNRGTLGEQIAEQISTWIFKGELAPGEFLPPEHVLAQQFGVSKTSVREATKVLASKGLVSIRQGVGTTVSSRETWNVLDPQILLFGRGRVTFDDLLQARRIFEPEIAALAAQQCDETILRMLHEAAEQGARVTSVDEHVRWDMAFHQGLADATGNLVLVIIMNSIGQMLRASRVALFTVDGSVERSSMYHRKIYEAVAAGDAEGSRTAMIEHLQQVASDRALLTNEDRA